MRVGTDIAAARSKPSGRYALPDARYFCLTWEIPADFAGMTTAFLARNRAFERLGGRAVDVLTFDPSPHYPELQRELRERGLLSPRARVINLWDWLRDHPQPAAGSARVPRSFSPLDPAQQWATTERDGAVLTRARTDAAGAVLQLDHYRADGSLLASDRRDVRRRGQLGGRSLVLCDASGTPQLSWARGRGLYHHWLDQLQASDPAVMLVDSKTVAAFMADYRRENAVVAHIIHGSHLTDRGDELRASRRESFERLADFDLVVALTEAQKRDIEARQPQLRNLVSIPNVVAPAARPPVAGRPMENAAVLASLIPRKRVSHAIRAVTAAREATGRALRLSVYGDGPQRPKLRALIGRLGAEEYVTLAGHVPDARRRLAETSMLLLTSHSEGFGLVLLEAMAEGCIPFAYDVQYGPAELITDGVNGFLVPAADHEALAARIEEFLALDEAAVERMRASARATAAAYSDENVTALWSSALQSAVARRAGRPAHGAARGTGRGARAAVRALRQRFGG
jgi:poly(glycerol-phosphate) alpha-glucosyltransferase